MLNYGAETFLAQTKRESLTPKILAGCVDKGTQHWYNTAV